MVLIECFTSFLWYISLIVGFIYFAKAVSALFTFLKVFTTTLNVQWADKYGKGSWAVVTGCTEGIGKAFCFELARLNFGLVLISRNQTKLEALNKQLWQKYPDLNIVIVQADFSEPDSEVYPKISSKILHLDISILVNNVGMATPNKFHLLSKDQIQQHIRVNVHSTTYMSQMLLPPMLEREKRSAIINISSQSILLPFRMVSVYTAVKAYDDLLSRCLAQEYRDKVDILSCRPALVSTAGSRYVQDPTACSAQQCARWTLKAVGKADVAHGHWKHILQYWIFNFAGQRLHRMYGQWKVRSMMKKAAAAAQAAKKQ